VGLQHRLGQKMRQSGDCVVVIIGGGPCGLMLAIELGRRGVSTIVLEEKSAPSRFPSANATQARIMEHYRRLGFAEKVRARGLPPDYPTDTAYFSRYTKYELARFSLPSARQAREIVKTLTGSWSAAELPHRVSQVFVEDVLRDEAAALSSVRLRPGWRMIELRETGTAVEVDAERSDGREQVRLQAAYVLGADGGGSPTRKALGYGYLGESGVVRDFIGGLMFAVHIRSSRLYDVIPHPRAWMYWAVNRERRGLMPSVNGRDEFTFHTQLRSEEKPEQITDAQAKLMFQAALGTNFDVDIVARSTWNAGHTPVAEKFQRGRIFLGGDAARTFSRAVLPIRSGCSFHRRNWKTTVPPARPRASGPAIISIIMRGSNSIFLASPSEAVTTARRSLLPTIRCRRRIGLTTMCRRPVPVAERPICGSQTVARFTMHSASSSPCCNSAQSMMPRRSRPRRRRWGFR
jgi:2-polyprenyl-6-methoxyphenol hydroxylase-like FAD-dependent oxidoreductase